MTMTMTTTEPGLVEATTEHGFPRFAIARRNGSMSDRIDRLEAVKGKGRLSA